MAKKASRPELSFDEQLVLFKYLQHELGIPQLADLGKTLNRPEYEGYNESGNTYFMAYLAQLGRQYGAGLSEDKLRQYDENICRHTRRISEKRGPVRWKYFQYLTLLFAELYLDRYFGDRDAFCKELNDYLRRQIKLISYSDYTPEKLNKLAIMCATGSGKTLMMHVNILQFTHYFSRAKRMNSRLAINKIIVLTPNEGMSRQHLEELELSSIPAAMFEKDGGFLAKKDAVVVIDINKLKDDGKVKTVSVDSFEQNNLVLVDEGHRGLSGNVWYDYRNRLSQEGFSFEYSATFKQALNANATGSTAKAKEERALMEEYGKSILVDYSYKFFYGDGYGKDYRIYNLRSSIDGEAKETYLTGCLLSFYQQVKLFTERGAALRDFNMEKPLLVFVGNRVTASTSKEELTDVEEVLAFLDRFLQNRKNSIDRLRDVLECKTNLIDASGNDLFYGNFYGLQHIFGTTPDPAAVFADMLRLVFNTDTEADAPRLHLVNLRQVGGEIALRVGQDGEFFGVISIGDTAGLIKLCDSKEIVTNTEEFVSESLFRGINRKESRVNLLIGSRKFTEGWNSWRVSTMGLINFAKGEGSQAIQLFGRGVRLKGYRGCLKRSSELNDPSVNIPQDIELLETLTIFGVKAQYMEDFKAYLALEGAPTNEALMEFRLPVVSRFEEVKDKKLRIIRLKNGANFKKQARRLILGPPDEGFLRYLQRSKTVIDCRSKIQTIDSTDSMKLEDAPEEHVLPSDKLQYLDFNRIFEELEEYKNEKSYYNLSIVRDKLMDILRAEGWYGLLIPKNHLEINSLAKLEAATDYAIMALKSYMDKFFRYEKERWEAPLMEYAELEANNANFVDEYRISYAKEGAFDHTGNDLEQFIQQAASILQKVNGLDSYDGHIFRDRLVAFDFRCHLYAPLICLKKGNLKIQITPVSLNEDEKRFVDRLKQYVDENPPSLAGKSLYLLRNKSRAGMGFFEAGNFYPDYILWIDGENKQYISFVDPKGLLQVPVTDPKVEFYRKIKDVEARLAPTAGDKQIILNSFILSGTLSYELRRRWTLEEDKPADKAFLNARNVYTLDDPDCVREIIEKIVGE